MAHAHTLFDENVEWEKEGWGENAAEHREWQAEKKICFTIYKWFSSRVNTKQVHSYIKFLLHFLSAAVAICSNWSYEKTRSNDIIRRNFRGKNIPILEALYIQLVYTF